MHSGNLTLTEADTCRKYVVPKLLAARSNDEPHAITEQRTFTDVRILIAVSKARRGPQKRADYLLGCTRDLTLAVAEAQRACSSPGTGLQQAKECAEILDLRFASSAVTTVDATGGIPSGKVVVTS